ncbi:MAG: EscU/YscU/HrcU family type III secretion system export apparatus switch protein [Thermanaerothrix sp.]|nr:EscU/YscU/HrcU family type III secretion system export apparatus switch protein [Thermanaerothrix sp.]
MSKGGPPRVRKAAALRYDKDRDDAPVVVASGRGRLADKILEVAREASVPIVEDAALVSALLALEVGDEIPPELYGAVAKVLAFVMEMERRASGGR